MPDPTAEVRIVAEFEAKPGCQRELGATLLAMVEPTRAEPGCVQYDLHVDKERDGHFLFFERFASADAVAFHNRTPHFLRLGDAVKGLIVGPPAVTRMRQIG